MLQIQGAQPPVAIVLRDDGLWWVPWMLLCRSSSGLRSISFDGGRWRRGAPPNALDPALGRADRSVRGRILLGRWTDDFGAPGGRKTISSARYLATDRHLRGGAQRLLLVRVLHRFRRMALAAPDRVTGGAVAAQSRRGAHPCAAHGAQPAFSVQHVERHRGSRSQARARRGRRHARATRRLAAHDARSRMPAEVPLSDELVTSGALWTSSWSALAIACA